MRIEFRVSQFLSDAIFELFRNEVLQLFSLLVYFVPGVTKNLAKEKLHQTVPANDAKRPFAAFAGQPRAAVLLISDARAFSRGQLLEHPGDRGCGNSQTLRDRTACSRFSRRATQFEDRFQVVID